MFSNTNANTVPPSPPSPPSPVNDSLLESYRISVNQKTPLSVHHKNGHVSTVLFVPVCNTKSTFRKIGQIALDRLVEQMSNNNKRSLPGPQSQMENNDKTCRVLEDASALLAIEHLAQKYPASFHAVAKNCDTSMRLDTFETSALIEYMDITEDAVYEKLNRFIRKTHGVDLLCPKRDLVAMQSNNPKPKVYSATVDVTSKQKKKIETVHGVEMTMEDEIKQRIQRYLSQSPTLFDKQEPDNQETPMFGYENPGNSKSILGVLGTDHGQEHSQFQLSLHLLPSQSRRDNKDKVHGIIDIPFSTIRCSKENSSILRLATPRINTSIELLENHKLMGCRNGKNVHCFWIHKDSTNIEIKKGDAPCVCYTRDGCNYTQCLPNLFQSQDDIRLFSILAPLHFVVISDLSAMFALMGRSGHSTSKCLKCDLNIKGWKATRGKVGLDLTKEMLLSMLNKSTPNIAGMKEFPLFNLPPERYLCPLLHLLLGLINDIMSKGIIPFALKMDGCTEEELEIREQLEVIENAINANPTRIERSLKARLKVLIKKRTSQNEGTDTAIRNKLTDLGLFFENYHGGTMNGNSCKKMCEKANEMMRASKEICKDKLQTHTTNGTLPLYSPTVEECDKTFDALAALLEVADVVFSGCNIITPTEQEILEIEENIEYMEERWYAA